jgi:hypothetical protein
LVEVQLAALAASSAEVQLAVLAVLASLAVLLRAALLASLASRSFVLPLKVIAGCTPVWLNTLRL